MKRKSVRNIYSRRSLYCILIVGRKPIHKPAKYKNKE
jgi:hypothetical protein